MAAVPELGRAAAVEREVAPEAAATHDLYERYSRQIYGFCLHQLGSREDAEDAVQTTFLNAFRGLRRGISPDAESAWLYKIAHNVCLTRRRSTYRRGRVETPGDIQALEEFVAAPPRSGADDLMELQDALAGMPPSQRTAILLREWRGLSYREIAEEMGLTQAAVETLIFRARRSLAEGLEQPPVERRKLLRRLRHGIDVGTLVAAVKGVLAGGAAVKAVATAAAVSTTVAAVAAVPSEKRVPTPATPDRPAATAKPKSATPAGTGERVVVTSEMPSLHARSGPAPTRPKPSARPEREPVAKEPVAAPQAPAPVEQLPAHAPVVEAPVVQAPQQVVPAPPPPAEQPAESPKLPAIKPVDVKRDPAKVVVPQLPKVVVPEVPTLPTPESIEVKVHTFDVPSVTVTPSAPTESPAPTTDATQPQPGGLESALDGSFRLHRRAS